jgi:hypothetical protein
MKKIVYLCILCVLLVMPITHIVLGGIGISLVIDGVDITSTLDAPPIIVNDRTMVPIRVISEDFGAEVS